MRVTHFAEKAKVAPHYCSLALPLSQNKMSIQESIYQTLHEIYQKHRRNYRENGDSKLPTQPKGSLLNKWLYWYMKISNILLINGILSN